MATGSAKFVIVERSLQAASRVHRICQALSRAGRGTTIGTVSGYADRLQTTWEQLAPMVMWLGREGNAAVEAYIAEHSLDVPAGVTDLVALAQQKGAALVGFIESDIDILPSHEPRDAGGRRAQSVVPEAKLLRVRTLAEAVVTLLDPIVNPPAR